MFFTVSGGAYGLEDMISSVRARHGDPAVVVTPIIWSVPAALMVAELGTAMPIEGGFYQWVKAGLGQFWGYQDGFWSWTATWVDMAIYPVLFADYLSETYVPRAAAGDTVFLVGSLQFDLHWGVACGDLGLHVRQHPRGGRRGRLLAGFHVHHPRAVRDHGADRHPQAVHRRHQPVCSRSLPTARPRRARSARASGSACGTTSAGTACRRSRARSRTPAACSRFAVCQSR